MTHPPNEDEVPDWFADLTDRERGLIGLMFLATVLMEIPTPDAVKERGVHEDLADVLLTCLKDVGVGKAESDLAATRMFKVRGMEP
jgi:hypothetical protein